MYQEGFFYSTTIEHLEIKGEPNSQGFYYHMRAYIVWNFNKGKNNKVKEYDVPEQGFLPYKVSEESSLPCKLGNTFQEEKILLSCLPDETFNL